MANLKFLKGLYQSLDNAAIAEGQILITKDTREMFVDVDASTRIKIGDFTVVATIAELEALDATKVPTSRLYYVEDGNILARSNGTTWIQVNKQKSASELKEFLGLGALAYKSEVAETDLNSDLAAKINSASGAQHSHDNKDVIDGITADQVTAWDAAEQNAKDYADGLNTAMNGRVEALEAIDHEHANKALLDTYTQTEADLADAVAKKHTHSFNETELNKIVEGDVAKWNGVAADHLTSADKTTLETAIKEAKKAGTDANTNIEAYKVTNDARVLAVEEDVAEIVDGTNGILAQAKSYSDNKLATARTEISAEIDADVKVVADELAGYKTSNDAALAGVKATAEAAATKEYTDAELAKKVDKVEGKSLVADTEITKLAGVSEGANKVEASENNGKIKIDGVETTVYTHPAKHQITDIEGLQDALDGKQSGGSYAEENHVHTKDQITDFAHTHVASEITDLDATIKTYDYATKTELGDVDAKFADYKTAADQKVIDDEQDRRLGVIEGDYLKAADIANFETKENVKKVADDLAAYVESNDAALAAETKARTEADAGFETRIAALEENFGDGEGTVEAQIAAAVAAEAEIARAAEKANADAIDALEGRMDTAEGKITALETESTKHAVKTEVEAALALKADKSVVDAMYTNEQIDAAILVETNRSKGVEEGLDTRIKAVEDDYLKASDKEELQTQINTIMNNPDTEGVINSINEFTQYISDHGEIAEGFRVDIDQNKEDIATNAQAIADETARATGAEDALGVRIDELKSSYDAHTHSWNDLTDKPFGEELIYSCKSRAEFIYQDGTDNLIEASVALIEGNRYTVVFDGITYTCVARNYDGYIMLGNNLIHPYDGDDTTDTGEPFAIEQEAGKKLTWGYLAESDLSEHVVQIFAAKTLDSKYLPKHNHSWNDLTDKPFGDSSIDPIENPVGDPNSATEEQRAELLFANIDLPFIKVSDKVLSASDVIGSTIYYKGEGFSDVLTVAAENIMECDGGITIIDRYGESLVVSVSRNDAEWYYKRNNPTMQTFYVWEPGTYIAFNYGGWVQGMVFPAGDIKTLDDKFISENIARVTDVDAVAERVATLEAIDHDAYVAADATLKTELQGEIKALADGQVAANAQAIADEKARAEGAEADLAAAIEAAKVDASNQDAVVLAEAQKYADQAVADAEGKVNELVGNVYTKEEVDAAVEAAVTAATTWGEF